MKKVDPDGVAIRRQMIGKKRVRPEFHIKGPNLYSQLMVMISYLVLALKYMELLMHTLGI